MPDKWAGPGSRLSGVPSPTFPPPVYEGTFACPLPPGCHCPHSRAGTWLALAASASGLRPHPPSPHVPPRGHDPPSKGCAPAAPSAHNRSRPHSLSIHPLWVPSSGRRRPEGAQSPPPFVHSQAQAVQASGGSQASPGVLQGPRPGLLTSVRRAQPCAE